MPNSYASADHLWSETLNYFARKDRDKLAHGFSARLTNIGNCFLWNKQRGLDPVKACGDLLFLLDFSYDGSFLQCYSPFADIDQDGNAVNAYGPVLRDQLSTAIYSLRRNPEANYAVLSPWAGVESQQLGLFKDADGLKPDNLLTAQFLYDGRQLNLFTNWRTIDAWYMPYDIFQWCNLLSIVCGFTGLKEGFLQINSAEVTLSDVVSVEDALMMSSESWYDREKPLSFNHKNLFQVQDPIYFLECASCLEELMRKHFDFGKRFADISKSGWLPFSSIVNCLSVVYLNWATLALECLPNQDRQLRINRVHKLVKVLSDISDHRLLRKTAEAIDQSYVILED